MDHVVLWTFSHVTPALVPMTTRTNKVHHGANISSGTGGAYHAGLLLERSATLNTAGPGTSGNGTSSNQCASSTRGSDVVGAGELHRNQPCANIVGRSGYVIILFSSERGLLKM